MPPTEGDGERSRDGEPTSAAVVPGLLLGAGALLSVCRVRSYDAPWVVAAGREIVRTRSLPSHDPFSYTAAVPWMHHEWLSEITLFAVERAAGWAGLSALAAVLGVLPVALLFRRPRARRAPLGLEVLAAAVLLLGLRETAEPVAQLFSTVLFALTLRLLLDANAGPPTPPARLPWPALLAVQLLWTQLHGGNPTGVTLIACWLLSAPSRAAAAPRAALLGAAAALTCAGPYGARVHEHFFSHRDTFAQVREFQPLHAALAAGSGLHFAFVGLLVAAAAALALRARRGEAIRFEAIALSLFTAVTLLHVRLATETAMVAAVALAPALLRAPLPGRTASAAILGAAILAIGVWASPRRLGASLDPARFPIAATAYLDQAGPPGPMFNSYNFGGYLLWARSEPVFIDGRAFTVYSDEQIRDLVALYDDPTRFAALSARWHFRLAVLQRHGRGAPLVDYLVHSPHWRTTYQDDLATILVHDN